MQINKIQIHIGLSGADLIAIYTDLPGPVYPFDNPASLKMEVAKGFGVEYAKEHFSKYEISALDHSLNSPEWVVINEGHKNKGECRFEAPKDYFCGRDLLCNGNCPKFKAKS